MHFKVPARSVEGKWCSLTVSNPRFYFVTRAEAGPGAAPAPRAAARSPRPGLVLPPAHPPLLLALAHARRRGNAMQNDLKPLLINNRVLCEMRGIDLNPQGSFGKRRFNL